jgi:hypothetical protein
MPEMTMKHRCEHTTTLRWRGTGHRPYTTISHREQMHAEARAEWCADCRRSRQNQASVREATLNRWRPLVGTVRQVSWATTIRSEHLERCLDLIETGEWLRIAVADELKRLLEFRPDRSRHASLWDEIKCRVAANPIRIRRKLRETILAERRASWWIEVRNQTEDVVIMAMALAIFRDDDDSYTTEPCAPVLPREFTCV